MTDLKRHDPDFNLAGYLAAARDVIVPSQQSAGMPAIATPRGELMTGVDLGTAYLVLAVLDESGRPLAGEYQFAEVSRDGLVVDFIGAVDRLKAMKARVEARLGRTLTHAASGYPPGVPQREVRSTAYVLESADLTCTGLLDEPSAANNVLNLQSGAIVDVGGGTTGVAIVQDGKVVASYDEPCGGTHFSLVIAGSRDIPFEEAERMKLDPQMQKRLLTSLKPVMEKVAAITQRAIKGYDVQHITLVGGTSAFPGMADVIAEYTGIATTVPQPPLFVTPLGIALHDTI